MSGKAKTVQQERQGRPRHFIIKGREGPTATTGKAWKAKLQQHEKQEIPSERKAQSIQQRRQKSPSYYSREESTPQDPTSSEAEKPRKGKKVKTTTTGKAGKGQPIQQKSRKGPATRVGKAGKGQVTVAEK